MMNNSQGASSFFSGLSTLLGRPHPLLHNLSDTTVTFRPIIAKSPGFVGGQATSEFRIDGDALTLTGRTVVGADGTSAPNVTGSLTLRRVE